MKTKTLMRKTKAELVEIIEGLNEELIDTKLSSSMLREKNGEQQAEIRNLRNRIKRLSLCYETLDGGIKIKTIRTKEREVYPEAWGEYIALGELPDEQIEKLKSRLIEDAATALVENGLVQFIVHDKRDNDPLSVHATVGLKMFVVPWEQMACKLIVRWRA